MVFQEVEHVIGNAFYRLPTAGPALGLGSSRVVFPQKYVVGHIKKFGRVGKAPYLCCRYPKNNLFTLKD